MSWVKLEDYRIPLDEIKLGTDNFSVDNYIGGGGFGKVYRAKLLDSRSHSEVAVKRLDPNSLQGKHEFLNEVSLLFSYQHGNIITFIGYCDEDNEMIVVSEYAINRSLDRYLRDTNKMSSISWEQRLKICIGAAKGLHYLHWGIGEHHRVIHRDIKSANILLDENWLAKISDFGLSKIGPKDLPYTHLHTRVAGTHGYCDPNYCGTDVLKKESDVYSFGVVLFEVLCGRLVFKRRGSEEDEPESLLEWVGCCYKDGVYKIIDPHIRDQIESKSLDTFKEIAYQCLKNNIKKRPTMATIVAKLEEALEFQIFSNQPPGDLPAFKEFKLHEILSATDGFSSKLIVSEHGEKAPNVVYRGELHSDEVVAVKRFSKHSWPNRKQFVAAATRVGKVRHKRLVNLIGCCAEGDERILVAEYMPNDTLSKHLFHWDEQPLPWEMRMRVAYHILQALEHCNAENQKIYYDLNAYRVLFDKDGDPRLSSFGLMKSSRDGKSYNTHLGFIPSKFFCKGKVIPESVIYSYGTVLLDLLCGVHGPPRHALELIRERNITLLMDLSLKGQYAAEDATAMVELAFKCLQHEGIDRPNIKFLLTAVAPLQKRKEVASHVFMGLIKTPVVVPIFLSLLGEACAKMDLTAVHDILLQIGYKDDEDIASELSFQMWTEQAQDLLNMKRFGDTAFRNKDFEGAVEYYSEVVSMQLSFSYPLGTVFVRRAFSHLMIGQPEVALKDAVQAQVLLPEKPTAYYMQALLLPKLGMETYVQDVLKEGSSFEAKDTKQLVKYKPY